MTTPCIIVCRTLLLCKPFIHFSLPDPVSLVQPFRQVKPLREPFPWWYLVFIIIVIIYYSDSFFKIKLSSISVWKRWNLKYEKMAILRVADTLTQPRVWIVLVNCKHKTSSWYYRLKSDGSEPDNSVGGTSVYMSPVNWASRASFYMKKYHQGHKFTQPEGTADILGRRHWFPRCEMLAVFTG